MINLPLIVCNFHTITCFRHLIKLLIYSRCSCNSLFFCDLNQNRLNCLAHSLTRIVALKALSNQNKTGKQTFVNKKNIYNKKTITTTINLRNNKSAVSVADCLLRNTLFLYSCINRLDEIRHTCFLMLHSVNLLDGARSD